MRISDWSSDVCSSDLSGLVEIGMRQVGADEAGEQQLGRTEIGALEVAAMQLGATQVAAREVAAGQLHAAEDGALAVGTAGGDPAAVGLQDHIDLGRQVGSLAIDRKSTRLNSSH